jgi:acyl dehydratase
MALLARQLYFEAVKVGDELPPLVKPPVDRTQVARYAGASGDYNPLHVDEHLARNAGFPSILAHGMLAMGFLGELVVDWLRGARLRRYAARFVKIVWPGDVITCRGRVVDRRFEGSGVYAIDLEVWAENQRGELVLKGLVTAQLYYNAEDDAAQRAGRAPLVVTPQEEEARLAKLSRAQPAKRPAPPAPPRLPPPAKPAPVPQRPAALRPAAAPVAPSPLHPAPREAVRAMGRGAPPSTPPAPAAPPRAAVKAAAPKAAPPPPPHAGRAPASGASTAPSTARRPAARRPEKASRPGPRRHAAVQPRPTARPVAKAKPAARASRPRVGSKPTGKKRR